MPILRLFASAREAAGTSRDEFDGATVAAVLASACARYGEGFTRILGTCRVWVNGEPAADDDAVTAGDEIAVLPPVSGGAVDGWPDDDGRAPTPFGDRAPERPPSAVRGIAFAAGADVLRMAGRPGGIGATATRPETPHRPEPFGATRRTTMPRPTGQSGRPAPPSFTGAPTSPRTPIEPPRRATVGGYAPPVRESFPDPARWTDLPVPTTTPSGHPQTPSLTASATSVATPSSHPRPPRPAAPRNWVDRLFAAPDLSGPRVTLGALWFAVLLPAAAFGATSMTGLFALVAACAGFRTASAWRRSHLGAEPMLAAMIAAGAPLAAYFQAGLGGAVLVFAPFVTVMVIALIPRGRRGPSVAAAAGATLRSAVPAALAGIGAVMVGGGGLWPAIVLVSLVSAYDAGSFLVGAEARSPIPGVIAGMVCTFTLALPVMVFLIPPFGGRPEALVYAGLVAVAAPLGQLVASASLPQASVWVGPLRRLDGFIVAAPLWAWVLSGHPGS